VKSTPFFEINRMHSDSGEKWLADGNANVSETVVHTEWIHLLYNTATVQISKFYFKHVSKWCADPKDNSCFPRHVQVKTCECGIFHTEPSFETEAEKRTGSLSEISSVYQF
jgi:hypothetical protein